MGGAASRALRQKTVRRAGRMSQILWERTTANFPVFFRERFKAAME
jgi:hypothetical protein